MTTLNFSPERLAAAREAARGGKGMTQIEAAEAAGISRATLQNAEGGKRLLRADALARLAEIYGVTLDSLFVHNDGEGATATNGRGGNDDGARRDTLAGESTQRAQGGI